MSEPLSDLREFVHDHRPHGTMTGDATVPAWNGYLVTVACPCGVVFGRWVTPRECNGRPDFVVRSRSQRNLR